MAGTAKPGTVAGVYAAALLELARERGSQQQVVDSCARIAAELPRSELLRLDDPRLSRSQAKAVLRQILEGQPMEVVRLFELLVDRNRLADAHAILEEVDDQHDAAQGITEVRVTTATPLSPASEQRLLICLRSRIGPNCEVFTAVEPALIGGITVRVQDFHIDGSVRRRLDEMKAMILNAPLSDKLWSETSA